LPSWYRRTGPSRPTGAREALLAAGIPCIIITDDVTTKKEEWEKIKASKFGYIIMKADAMIGARREFLDPIEMADYNGNLIKVLALTGAFRKLQVELDKVIDQVKAGKKGDALVLPKMVVSSTLPQRASSRTRMHGPRPVPRTRSPRRSPASTSRAAS